MPYMTDYDATCREFRLPVPEHFNFALDVVDAWAVRAPDKLALVAVAADGAVTRHSFAQLKAASDSFASALLTLGIPRGARALLMVPRIPEVYSAFLGMHKAGVVPMPAPVSLRPNDCAYRIQRAAATVAVVHVDCVPVIEAIRDRCPTLEHLIVVGGAAPGWRSFEALCAAAKPLDAGALPVTRADDPLLIYFTSGTTKHPKMVLHRHSYALAHTLSARFWLDLGPDDVHWTLADTGWAKFAWGKLYGPWNIGAAIVLYHAPAKFDARTHLDLLRDLGVTSFCAPPTAWRMLIQENLADGELPGLRHCTAAGEPLNPEVIRAWRAATGLTIYDGYGQTETINLIGNYACVPVRPGSMGKPVPGMPMAIVDDDGTPVADGEEGHIAIRVRPDAPPGVCQGYHEDPDATAAAWVGDWYFTGDRGYRDPDGYYWFVGRSDDVIKASGYRIGPFEVESALQSHPAVAESAVVGKPDELRGTIVKAFVVLAPGHSGSEALVADIQAHVKRETAPYKYPREIEFVAELPKTISGKIRRVELRARDA